MKTANGLFSYDQLYLNKTLNEHTNIVHKLISKKCGWGSGKLVKGMFGYDNFIMSIGYVFKYCPDKLNKESICEFAHEGWAMNYIFWRDNKPWLTNSFYKKPGKCPGDARRNLLAATKHKDLPDDEKIPNIIIAEYILNIMTKMK